MNQQHLPAEDILWKEKEDTGDTYPRQPDAQHHLWGRFENIDDPSEIILIHEIQGDQMSTDDNQEMEVKLGPYDTEGYDVIIYKYADHITQQDGNRDDGHVPGKKNILPFFRVAEQIIFHFKQILLKRLTGHGTYRN